MISSRYEKTRVNLGTKIRNNFIEKIEELDEGICYLCKGKISDGLLLEYNEIERNLETVAKIPVHKSCYDLSKNYIFYCNSILGIN